MTYEGSCDNGLGDIKGTHTHSNKRLSMIIMTLVANVVIISFGGKELYLLNVVDNFVTNIILGVICTCIYAMFVPTL